VRRIKRAKLRHHAKFHDDGSNRCQDMGMVSIFQNSSDGHLGFLNFKILTEGSERSNCIKLSNFVAIGQTIAEILRFFIFLKMAATAIFDIQIFEILTVGTVTRAKFHHLDKFHGDRLNRCRDVAIFRFFQDGGRPPSTAAILELMYMFGPPTKRIWCLYHCAKFGWNRCGSFDNIQVIIFCQLG